MAHIDHLLRIYNGVCHYCERKTSRAGGLNGLYPTKDHVVPKAFGGSNSIDNYVLSCAKCNNKRGTMLFFCECRDCQEKILDALYDPEAVNKIFYGLMNHNKPVIHKHHSRPVNKWGVRIGHNQKFFSSFENAVTWVDRHKAIAKDKNYGF